MKRLAVCLIAAGTLLAAIGVPLLAQDFKPYPGASKDEKTSREATAAAQGKQSDVYLTGDSFEKVYAFYKGLYKEYVMRRRSAPPKLRSGEQVQLAFFILDGAKDLASSEFWMKIQWPYVGTTDGKDVRDITVIQTVRGSSKAARLPADRFR